MGDLEVLSEAVQRNCHISDARHAREHSLCIYLLKMREYFRWERGLALMEALPAGELGDWVERREALWESLAGEDLACLPLAEGCLEPFDVEAINRLLLPQGLVYSAGYGRFANPHFFLGRLVAREEHDDGYEVLVADAELARDLSALPAMLQGRRIYVRRDAVRRMLWERIEEWRWRKRPEDAMARAIAAYDFTDDPVAALEAMTEREVAAAVLHERGEAQVDRRLGAAWPEALMAVTERRVEIAARAVRDLLADFLVTLPGLLAAEREASLHFYFSNLRGMRRVLSPGLARAYADWVGGGDLSGLHAQVGQGAEHWARVTGEVLERLSDNPTGEAGLADWVEAQGL